MLASRMLMSDAKHKLVQAGRLAALNYMHALANHPKKNIEVDL